MFKPLKNLLFILLLTPVLAMAQTQKGEDSIRNLLENATNDSVKIQLYIKLGNGSLNTEHGAQYAIEGVKFCEEHNGPERYRIELMHVAANQFLNSGNYSKALEYYLLESKAVEAHDPGGPGMAAVDMGIGNVYASQNSFQKALDYYQKGLNIILKSKNPGRLGYSIAFYANIGGVYVALKEYDKAIDAFKKELYILRNNKEPSYEFGNIYSSMGEIYENKKEYDTAWAYYIRALTNYKGIDLPERVATGYNNLARVYVEKGEYDAAIPYYDQALEYAVKTNAKDIVVDIYHGYAEAYEKEGNYRKAYEYHTKYSDAKDSLMSLASQKQMNELETKYESATKDKELLQKDAESKRQKILILFVLAVAVAVGVIAVIIFRSLKTTNKQKKLIEEQKALVEEKNSDILASIRYAQRIQHALLASDTLLKKQLPEYFVLFKPKDIVSGDFYWAAPLGEAFALCTGDCTGHGVPGAFMSLLNISLLNEAAIERKIAQPNQILDYVRGRVKSALNPEGREEESKDGMDCSLCVFDFKNKKLEAACGNNPVWVARNNNGNYTIEEIAADKMPVGIYGGEEKPFTLNSVSLNKGDIVYTFSDGYADQFGGAEGKKFKKKQLQQLVINACKLPMAEQKARFEKAFEDWKGRNEQTDDVLVIGIRI